MIPYRDSALGGSAVSVGSNEWEGNTNMHMGKGRAEGRERGKKTGVDLLWNNQRRLYGNVT